MMYAPTLVEGLDPVPSPAFGPVNGAVVTVSPRLFTAGER